VNRRIAWIGLCATLGVDILSVASLVIHSAFDTAAGAPGASVTWGYAEVGLAGLILAVVAIVGSRGDRDLRRNAVTRARAVLLIWIGLAINTIGCLLVLVDDPANHTVMGVLLLIGGDFLSIAYLAFLSRITVAARE
jgi:hypothetical protein